MFVLDELPKEDIENNHDDNAWQYEGEFLHLHLDL